MSYTPAMTKAPATDAYLARMARRDDPNDYGVCEHNVVLNVTLTERPCLDGCSPAWGLTRSHA